MEPDWVLPLCQRLPSPWSELHNDYIIFYRIHFQSLADLSTPVKSHRIPGTTISGLIHVLEIHYYFLSDIFSFRQLCSTQWNTKNSWLQGSDFSWALSTCGNILLHFTVSYITVAYSYNSPCLRSKVKDTRQLVSRWMSLNTWNPPWPPSGWLVIFLVYLRCKE